DDLQLSIRFKLAMNWHCSTLFQLLPILCIPVWVCVRVVWWCVLFVLCVWRCVCVCVGVCVCGCVYMQACACVFEYLLLDMCQYTTDCYLSDNCLHMCV